MSETTAAPVAPAATSTPGLEQAETLLRQAEATLAQVAQPTPVDVSATVDAWFVAHFNNVPLGDTAMVNHVSAALADLKKRLGA